MKKTLGLCLLLSGMLPGFSQGRDTAFAVHKLFQQRRASGNGWAATGVTAITEESVGWRAIRSPSENTTAAIVSGGIPLVVGLVQAQRFSREREQNILQRYAQGWSIPSYIRRRLRRKHFHRISRDVSPAAKP